MWEMNPACLYVYAGQNGLCLIAGKSGFDP